MNNLPRRSSFPLSVAAMALCAPGSVRAAPRAETDPAKILASLRVAQDDFQARQISRLDNIEALVDSQMRSSAADSLRPGDHGMPADPEYSRTFASWARSGRDEDEIRRLNADGYRAQVNASMDSGSGASGGYLAPTEWDRKIHKAERNLSPMRRISTVITTGVGAFSTVWSDGTWGSGWVGETAARAATATPTLSSLEFASGEIYANAPITQRLLDDASLDVGSWLATEIGGEFAIQEGAAFLTGNGTNKPFGLLAYVTGGAADGHHPGGNLTVRNGGHASTLIPDGLVGFAYAHQAEYRQGATWLMNSATAATIAKLKDTTDQYIWREGMAAGQPATLLGYPVEIDEAMPDVAADALPIAFGNFQRGYLINDRTGVRILRDPYTNKPFVNFYATKRVGGGVIDPKAIQLLKIAA